MKPCLSLPAFLSATRVVVCCLAAAATLILTPYVGSQATQQKFTSTTELVLIPAVVNSKSGSHISGLTKDDFALKQDGKSQPVAIFEEVITDNSRVRRSAGEQGTFSNIEPGGRDYPRVSIIVLDFVNTPLADQTAARTALIKFLSEVADSGEPMCLLVLSRGGLTLLHDLTADPAVLAVALKKAKANEAPLVVEPFVDPHHPEGGDVLAAALAKMIRGELQLEAQAGAVQNKVTASITVDALQQIAKAFHGLPGRKSLIWASSGFPFSLSQGPTICETGCTGPGREQMQSAYDKLSMMMNDAQIAIYSVDLRSADNTFLVSGGVRPQERGDSYFDTDARARATMHDTTTTLQQFADSTGGKAFLGGGNLVQSFRQAIQDDSSYYMLGYYISRKNTRPGWHTLAVSVNTKGARVRHRQGFFLSRETSTDAAKQDIQLALRSPLDYTGIPVSVTWTGNEPGKIAGRTKVRFDLVMPASFAAVDESDKNHMVVDIAAVARKPNGDVAADLSQRIDVHLESTGLEQIQHNGMTYRNGLQLPPGEYNVCFVVRDAIGNRMGSVAVPARVAP